MVEEENIMIGWILIVLFVLIVIGGVINQTGAARSATQLKKMNKRQEREGK